MDALVGATVVRCINEYIEEKMIALLIRTQTFEEGQLEGDAVVLIQKTAPSAADGEGLLKKLAGTTATVDLANDIYTVLSAKIVDELKVRVIHPCTQKHIDKYSYRRSFFFRETAQFYNEKLGPLFVDKIPASTTQWVENILSRKCEWEACVFDDPDPTNGFMIHPDLKFDGKNVQELHYVALTRNRALRSIRSIKSKAESAHLRQIQQQALETLTKRHATVTRDQLVCYLHYPPTYYHLHVHIVHVSVFLAQSGLAHSRARLLDDVCDAVERAPAALDYSYAVAEHTELADFLQQHL